jgi:hypothetical protein
LRARAAAGSRQPARRGEQALLIGISAENSRRFETRDERHSVSRSGVIPNWRRRVPSSECPVQGCGAGASIVGGTHEGSPEVAYFIPAFRSSFRRRQRPPRCPRKREWPRPPRLGGKQLKLAKKTRRAKPHMWHGLNRAACQAYGAALLIMKCGFTIEQAIACTGSHTNYIDAMRWIVESDDPALLRRVLYGRADIFDAAAQVRPLIEMRAAFKKLTSEQRIDWAVEENPDSRRSSSRPRPCRRRPGSRSPWSWPRSKPIL